jgi:hypothetical protein
VSPSLHSLTLELEGPWMKFCVSQDSLDCGALSSYCPSKWRQVRGAETNTRPTARVTVNVAVYGVEPDHLPYGGGLLGSWKVQLL